MCSAKPYSGCRRSHSSICRSRVTLANTLAAAMDLCGTLTAELFHLHDGAIVVNIPAPTRFAVHKLIVHGERAGSFRTKANKDLLQAAALIDRLVRHCHLVTIRGNIAAGDSRSQGPSTSRAWAGRSSARTAALSALRSIPITAAASRPWPTYC